MDVNTSCCHCAMAAAVSRRSCLWEPAHELGETCWLAAGRPTDSPQVRGMSGDEQRYAGFFNLVVEREERYVEHSSIELSIKISKTRFQCVAKLYCQLISQTCGHPSHNSINYTVDIPALNRWLVVFTTVMRWTGVPYLTGHCSSYHNALPITMVPCCYTPSFQYNL